MRRILLLEDDVLFNETLEDFLEEEGFILDTALDPYSALDLSYEHNYDLYLFDVNLPYESGFSLLHTLRKAGDETPCIFLTSREDKASLEEGFSSGGDDYLRKPVDLDELLLRIKAILRRKIRKNFIQIGEYHFDTINKMLYKDDIPIKLNTKAKELLLLLLEGKGELVSLEYIKERLWSSAEGSSEGALRVYVTQLNKYFPKLIQNVRSMGYKMKLK